MPLANLPFTIPALLQGYRTRQFTPKDVVALCRARIEAASGNPIWIHVLDDGEMAPWLARLADLDPATAPLWGVPFAIKDNIDLAGVPTTAACPAFAYTPSNSATVVERLLGAGALPIGKTNLDQFATGLVGTRSPYGAVRNAFHPDFISGGSSGGSAVAVALGQVAFALGTDTAGSGRVPAAFNNLVGLKPTRGRISNRGMVPACRSLDVVSVFAFDTEDAWRVFDVAQGYDAEDPWSRKGVATPPVPARFTFGVPTMLEPAIDAETACLLEHTVEALRTLGGEPRPVDFSPMLAAARLLYEGPWVAERYAALKPFIEREPAALHPVTRAIIEPARQLGAVEAFEAQYRLAALKREADHALEGLDFVLAPTVGAVPTLAEVEAEPIAVNSRLGTYTNFMNLLDYAALAVPAGFGADGLPRGVTLFVQAFADEALLAVGTRLQRSLGLTAGATGLPAPAAAVANPPAPDTFRLAVCGAHMGGLPLNPQLTTRGARHIATTRTAPHYRLFALPGGPPRRPGLLRVEQEGASIELEVWDLPLGEVGAFLREVPSPLAIGTLDLVDGSRVQGFLCEGSARSGARDITALGGWRAFLCEQADGRAG